LAQLHELTGYYLSKLIHSGETSSVEVTKAVLDQIRKKDSEIKAYVTVTEDLALEQAKAVDEALARGERPSPIAGVPIAIKDNICTKGIRTTCSSKILSNFVPPYDATVIHRVKEAGLVIVGKTNLDEFAMGASTEHSGFFPTRNPHDPTRVPGGSSGGSAAAVASGMAIVSLGSDTGGSVREPAAFCGVVGLKPTYGRVSRYGLVAFASSLDQIGPITKDVGDCAFLAGIIAGHDPLDSTSMPQDVPDYGEHLVTMVKGLKVGVIEEFMGEGTDPSVKDAVQGSADILASLGCDCEPVSLPHIEYSIAAYYIIAPSEASSNLARYDGVLYGHRAAEQSDIVDMYCKTRDEGFGDEVKRRIMLGTYALSAGYYDAYYLKAQRVRALIKRDFDKALERHDLLISPTYPSIAFKLGEKVDDPLAMYVADLCTLGVNLAGLPAISIPCGKTGGLPMGLQIIGRPFDERTILRAAFTLEDALSERGAI
jgi:aspartyl-tRNA(Asn)/glutamyl-tRNA(Gln) amidotransferase subunit A